MERSTRPRYRVPDELRETLLDFTIAYLLERPTSVVDFGVDFFSRVNAGRRGETHTKNEQSRNVTNIAEDSYAPKENQYQNSGLDTGKENAQDGISNVESEGPTKDAYKETYSQDGNQMEFNPDSGPANSDMGKDTEAIGQDGYQDTGSVAEAPPTSDAGREEFAQGEMQNPEGETRTSTAGTEGFAPENLE